MLDFSKNYFELFGLPVGFEVDSNRLSDCYRELQRAIHPDRYANATEQEKRLSMQGSTRLNDALNTLKKPLLRAQYLLELKGVDLGAKGSSITDSSFLMEQMELREELAGIKGQPDPYDAVACLMNRIKSNIQGLLSEISEQFAADTPQALEQVQETVNKLQFLYKLSAQVEELEEELDEAL
ncbi:Fe-S protein assembly co-chaperone HscB [Pseudomonadota bacterium]